MKPSNYYDPMSLTIVCEIFSLDVYKYFKENKFIYYVYSTGIENFSNTLHQLNIDIIKEACKKNKYLKFGMLTI